MTSQLPLLLSDPRVAAVPVIESGEPMVRLDGRFGSAQAVVRAGLAERLLAALVSLPPGVGLRVVEGHRSVASQEAIIERYDAEVRAAYPDASAAERHHLVSRFVAPVDVAPHVAGAAVDLTLTDLATGRDLDLGTAIDATPEQSDGGCFLAATSISLDARVHRLILTTALHDAGLVNYPTEWWHWSFGDRYWALVTGAPVALYGPVRSLRCEPEIDRSLRCEPEIDRSLRCEPEIDRSLRCEPEIDRSLRCEPEIDRSLRCEPEIDRSLRCEPEIDRSLRCEPEIDRSLRCEPEIDRSLRCEPASLEGPGDHDGDLVGGGDGDRDTVASQPARSARRVQPATGGRAA